MVVAADTVDVDETAGLRSALFGQTHDPSTGLMHYNARYYDPQIGRFISADTIVPNPADPQDLNRYSYVGNNPTNMVDPSGHTGGTCQQLKDADHLPGSYSCPTPDRGGEGIRGPHVGSLDTHPKGVSTDSIWATVKYARRHFGKMVSFGEVASETDELIVTTKALVVPRWNEPGFDVIIRWDAATDTTEFSIAGGTFISYEDIPAELAYDVIRPFFLDPFQAKTVTGWPDTDLSGTWEEFASSYAAIADWNRAQHFAQEGAIAEPDEKVSDAFDSLQVGQYDFPNRVYLIPLVTDDWP